MHSCVVSRLRMKSTRSFLGTAQNAHCLDGSRHGGTVFSLSGKCSCCTVVTRPGVVREPLRGPLSDDLLVAEVLE